MDRELVRLSKFLSLVLRHRPELIGLTLDRHGWVKVDALIDAVRRAGVPLDLDRLRRVVAENDKQRFAFSEDGTRIRASQGHSLPIDLGLERGVPPELLYHGTATRFLDSIRRRGLRRRGRTHVHLSPDEPAALKVGMRHGAPVTLVVRARAMHGDGYAFYLSDNGVWLTAAVPPTYLIFPGDD